RPVPEAEVAREGEARGEEEQAACARRARVRAKARERPEERSRQCHAPEGAGARADVGEPHENRRERDKGRAREQRSKGGPHGPAMVLGRLLQVVPALERRFVALARELHFLLENRLPCKVVFVGPAAAGGAAGALAGQRLDALIAPREHLLERAVGRAHFVVRLVELAAAIL